MTRFSFYTVDSAYCDYLRTFDPCVPYTIAHKSTRPFIGIVLNVGDVQYYAPLTSPKPKHLTMKNQVDFLKINGGVYGAINFNNMIPIHSNSLSLVDMTVYPTDNAPDIQYKNLLANQLSWCNANRELLFKKAETLYKRYIDGTLGDTVKSRCCNFSLDEIKLREYVASKTW
ncbi:MAG: type III toxin-antitoxin system ToxN/AbiQ family toxin [Clostridia bacterium]|nr:type III toxin-antitoxin system ToxN/AbiQ family toxin [Clostridia bacterium]